MEELDKEVDFMKDSEKFLEANKDKYIQNIEVKKV
jgi:hypothetical protein